MHIRLPHWTHRAGMTAIEEPTCPSGGRSAVGLATLGVAQGLLTGSVLIAQTLGTLEARRISDSVPVAGAALAAQLIGAAVSLMLVSRPVEHHMPRNGVLRTGFCLCAVGLATGGVAVAMRWLAPLILGSAIFGAGASLALLLRTVALEGRRHP